MERAVKELLETKKIDLVYIKRLRSAQYVMGKTSVPIMLDATDAMSLFYKRLFFSGPYFKKLFYLREWLTYFYYESKMMKRAKHWILCSIVDIGYLKQRHSNVIFHLVPNGVDFERFYPSEEISGNRTILMSGLMDKFVNVEAAVFFAKEIFPIVREYLPDAKFRIVGPKPSKRVRRLDKHGIEIVGNVADLRNEFAKARVVVCPIKTGTGTRFKILQAWAMKKPVVTTSRGVEGLEAENYRHVLVADDSRDFANKVIEIMTNENLRKTLKEEGYKLALEKYSSRKIVSDLESHLSNAIKTIKIQ